MKYWLPIILSLTVVLGGGYYFYSSQPDFPDVRSVRFTLLNGRRIDMPQLSDKTVLVTFWATTCASCIKEVPDLIKLYELYAAKGLEIIAVAMPYDRPDHVLEFTRTRQLPYPVSLDIDAQISRRFGNVRVTPNHFFVNQDGRIIRHQIGILDIPEIEQLLQNRLTPKD